MVFQHKSVNGLSFDYFSDAKQHHFCIFLADIQGFTSVYLGIFRRKTDLRLLGKTVGEPSFCDFLQVRALRGRRSVTRRLCRTTRFGTVLCPTAIFASEIGAKALDGAGH